MDFKIFLSVFLSIFIAELGDKTQLATMTFASNKNTSKLFIFLSASLALILSSGLAVLVGNSISNFIGEKLLRTLGGIIFIIIGLWTLIRP